MKNPFLSFTVAAAIYFCCLLLFAEIFFKETSEPQVSLTIDSELIGEVIQHERSKSKNSDQELEKISLAKKNIQKDREERLEPKDSDAKKEQQHQAENIAAKKVPLLSQPLPEIPEELRFEAFNSYAILRFYVTANGDVSKLEMIKPCANPKLNQLLMKSLKSWKFAPSSGEFTQEIRVTFRVE